MLNLAILILSGEPLELGSLRGASGEPFRSSVV